MITLQKTLFHRERRVGPYSLVGHDQKKGQRNVASLESKSPFVYKAEEQYLRHYTQGESTREEADYPNAACFPEFFDHPWELQGYQAIVSLIVQGMGETLGWSRTLES